MAEIKRNKAKQSNHIKPAPKAKAKPRELNVQQRLFVAEYIKDRNATQAAIRAGYSEKTAYSIGGRLLKDVEVLAAIEAFVIKAEEKAGLSIEKTLRELARLAYFDPRKLFNPDGTPKPIQDLDDDTAACLAGLDVHEEYEGVGENRVFVGYTKKYKIADKNSAIDKAMKHLGLFEKDNKQKPAEVVAKIVMVPAKEKAEVVTRKLEQDKG